MKTRLIRFLVFISFGAIFSCKKEPNNPNPSDLGKGCFIVNEGNYNWGNATLDYYDFSTETLTSDLFQKVNNRPLGDVFQSMIIYNKRAYLVINNSGKVEVCNATTMESIATLTGLNSPRYILPISDTKFYITDLYDKNIAVVDPASVSITKKILLNYWSEELIFSDNQVFVCAMKSEYVYVVNPLNDQIIDSISVGYSPSSIVKASNGNLFVISEGSPIAPIVNSSITEINPISHSIVNQWTLSSSGGRCLRTNKMATVLYFIFDKNIYYYDVGTSNLPSGVRILGQTRNFYGINVRPDNGDLYVFDAKDYVQRGALLIFDHSGNLRKEVKTGIIPSAAYF